MKKFEIAGASVAGTTHVKRGINNQDFFHWLFTEEFVVAIVSDGCGSTKHSEVGSRILSTIFAHCVAEYLKRGKKIESEKLFHCAQWWEEIRHDVLARIRLIAQTMGEDWWSVLRDYFLATLVGVVVREDTTCIFSCGDGFFAINGGLQEIGPFEDNKPPYLVYGLTGSEITDSDATLLQIQRNLIIPTSEVHSLMIGTDGVGDLVNLAERPLPAQETLIGSIDQFWSEDIYFTNPIWMRNKLTVINTEKRRIDWEGRNIQRFPGLLPDDTTLITLKEVKV
ncbi:MAG: protein phosphatase 2C domain-containing protein [Candidatus Peribacteria bacterium]|nr:protein phosphatase 2C domain-containing protein [Candidatus Peribacteria bacterium]